MWERLATLTVLGSMTRTSTGKYPRWSTGCAESSEHANFPWTRSLSTRVLPPRARLREGLLRSWLLGDCEAAGSAGNPEDDESEAFACKPWEPFDQAAVLTVVGKGDLVGGFRVVHAL